MLERVQMAEAVSDDELHAYVDGALADAERARLEGLLASDGELRARLEKVRRAAAALREAYPMPADAGDRFRQLVEEGFRERERARFRPRPANDWRQPMAAALALAVVTGGGGYWLGLAGGARTDVDLVRIEPGNPLFAALEHTPSGETTPIGADGAVKPILTLQSASGDYCREIEFDSADMASVGVACRGDDGWRMVVLAAAETGPGAEGGYATVGEDGAAAIEAVFARLGGGDPLSVEDEQALIEAGWRAP